MRAPGVPTLNLGTPIASASYDPGHVSCSCHDR